MCSSSRSPTRSRHVARSFMQGGKAMVEVFRRAGVDYIFSSPGTEWPPVWEALAEAQERGDNRLGYINCRHEAAAVAMASGYTRSEEHTSELQSRLHLVCRLLLEKK